VYKTISFLVILQYSIFVLLSIVKLCIFCGSWTVTVGCIAEFEKCEMCVPFSDS